MSVDPAPIVAVDQDIGINAPVKYTSQNGILPFLYLNPQNADITLLRKLMDHELTTPATIVIKVIDINLNKQMNIFEEQNIYIINIYLYYVFFFIRHSGHAN